MLDSGKTFLVLKKHDLCNNSKGDIDPKKAKDATSSSSYSNHDLFE